MVLVSNQEPSYVHKSGRRRSGRIDWIGFEKQNSRNPLETLSE
jgi:hypothetical protein